MVDQRFYQHLGPISLATLLGSLDVECGDKRHGKIQIHNAAPADLAGSQDISYLKRSKRPTKLENCKAAICFVHNDNIDHVKNFSCVPVVSKHPRADFAHILSKLYAEKEYGSNDHNKYDKVKIGANVVIGAGAEIGQGTKIGPNSTIGPGVVLGENCTIGANVVIEFSLIGNNCKVHHGAVIGGTGFGIALGAQGGVDIPHVGRVVIGDNVSVGCQTTIDRAMFGDTVIGNGCKFDNLVQIAHNNKIGDNCLFAAQVGIAGSCDIGSGVVMGGKAGVADHIKISDGATLAAHASTMHNIPEGEVWSGVPAMPIRQHMRSVSAIRRLTRKKVKPAKEQG